MGGYVGYFGPLNTLGGKDGQTQFQSIPAPITASAKHHVTSSSKVVIGQRVVSREANRHVMPTGTAGDVSRHSWGCEHAASVAMLIRRPGRQ